MFLFLAGPFYRAEALVVTKEAAQELSIEHLGSYHVRHTSIQGQLSNKHLQPYKPNFGAHAPESNNYLESTTSRRTYLLISRVLSNMGAMPRPSVHSTLVTSIGFVAIKVIQLAAASEALKNELLSATDSYILSP